MKTKEIKWNTSKADAELITIAVWRWGGLHVNHREMDAAMGLTATHLNGCRLNLKALLAFDDANFAHDIGGILRHLDRETGKLGGEFRPRCAK